MHTRILYVAFALAVVLAFLTGPTSQTAENTQQSPPGKRQVDDWLDYDFDPEAALGSAKNPAVLLPSELTSLLPSLPGTKRQGDVSIVPAAELKQAANLPFAKTMLAPILNRLSSVKSFDGFSAIDGTALFKRVPSYVFETEGKVGRALTGENPDVVAKQLRNGDLVFGSHIFNFMTWGKYNHVAIVTDAARGTLMESTAEVPTDKPGVRHTDWKSFAKDYVHVGLVRVRNARPEQLAAVVRWVEDRKGKPYRWPIIMGLDTKDESRFYCSQLVWLAFRQVMGIDLDYDRGVLIFPDDIYDSTQYVDQIVP
jgi:uncharacterized protein YycO